MKPVQWVLLFSLIFIALAQNRLRLIENSVVGDPKIECEPDKILIAVQTQNTFKGNIYVKGYFRSPECKSDHREHASGAYLQVKLNECGMIRTQQENPSGTNYKLEVVVSFHPLFETRQDEAYSVDCFYKNEEIKVNSNMSVNESAMLRNPPESYQGVVENPRCEYSIREESVNGQLARFTQIGQPVVHRWECEDKNMGILVKDCFAQSESVFSEAVIDSRGCAISGFFEELTYDSKLTMAFVRVETFKFPDMDTIRFACNISFCNKLENECLGISPPNCPNIRRSEFLPKSEIDSSVDPTRIYTFINDPFQMRQSPLFKTTRRYFPFQPITVSTHSPFVFNPMDRRKDYVKNEGPDYVEVLPAKQLPIIKPIASRPIPQAPHIETTSNPSVLLLKKNKPTFQAMSNERNVRARRAEDTVMSVKAETLVVGDLPNLKTSVENQQKRSIVMLTKESDKDMPVCFSKSIINALIVLLAVLSCFSLAASVYILYDIFSIKNRRIKAQITSRRESIPSNEFAFSIRALNK